MAAILIGVAYFLKYAFDSEWIGPGGRIALGLMAGIAVIVLSEIVRRQGQAAFSYSLKAVGSAFSICLFGELFRSTTSFRPKSLSAPCFW